MNKWWGYLHNNGEIQVKRYFGDPLDIKEASESPFVRRVIRPFDATDRQDAINKIKISLEGHLLK